MIWKKVDGWPYEVSDGGHVRSVITGNELAQAKSSRRENSYRQVTLCAGGGVRKSFLVHGLIASVFIGPRPDGLHVNHKDGLKWNNSVLNLEYVTPKENQEHASRMGMIVRGANHPLVKNPEKAKRGEGHGMSKLTEEGVREIRRMRGDGYSFGRIGAALNVHYSTAWNVIQGKTWRHV